MFRVSVPPPPVMVAELYQPVRLNVLLCGPPVSWAVWMSTKVVVPRRLPLPSRKTRVPLLGSARLVEARVMVATSWLEASVLPPCRPPAFVELAGDGCTIHPDKRTGG